MVMFLFSTTLSDNPLTNLILLFIALGIVMIVRLLLTDRYGPRQ